MDYLATNMIFPIIAGVVVAFISWLTNYIIKHNNSRITVHRITSMKDFNVYEKNVFELLKNEINISLRDKDDTIIGWVRQSTELKRTRKCFSEDFFLVSKIGKSVNSLSIYTYFTFKSLLLLDYHVFKDGYDFIGEIDILLRTIPRDWKMLAVAFEADEDNDLNKKRSRFFNNVTTKYKSYEVDIDFILPKIALDDNMYKETKLTLIILPTKRYPVINGKIDCEEILEILYYIYIHNYANTYLGDFKKDLEYRKYIQSVYERYLHNLRNRDPVNVTQMGGNIAANFID